MSYRDVKSLKRMVEDVLNDIPATRNSDIALTIEVWKRFYPQRVFTSERYSGSGGNRECITLQSLYDLPREDNVKRTRAYLQNVRKLYLPTDAKVARARGINEDEWRVGMGYPTVSTAGTVAPSWKPPSERTMGQNVPLRKVEDFGSGEIGQKLL